MNQRRDAAVVPVLVIAGLIWLVAVPLMGGPTWAAAWGAIFVGFLPAAWARWNRWQATRTGWGGALIIYPVVFVVAYTLGSVKFGEVSILGVDPDTGQWLLCLLGLAAWMLGAAWSGKTGTPTGISDWIDRPLVIPVLAGLLGILLAGVNYATGGIPLLSSNVNAERFGDTGAMFGRLTGVIVGLEQFALVAIGIEWMRRRKHRTPMSALPALIAALSFASLAVSASRTFVALPIVALAIIVAERRKVSIVAATIVAALLLSVFTWFNLARQEASGTRGQLEVALEREGLADYPLASGLLSLQIGPRVFATARQKIPDGGYPYQRGHFFLTDGSIFLRTHEPHPSDWFTTTVITGRNYEVVGGSPPTVVGGLYVDGGPWLIAVGMMLLGLVTRRLRDRFLRTPHVYTAAAYAFWGAWMLHSIYNYVSLKPMVVTFMLCALAGALTGRQKTTRTPAKVRFATSR